MDAILEAKLTRIQMYRTRYELAAIHPDGRRMLVGYTEKRSRAGLLGMVRQRGAKFTDATGADSITFGKRATDGATAGDWIVAFTGRTQREAYIAGELASLNAGGNRPE